MSQLALDPAVKDISVRDNAATINATTTYAGHQPTPITSETPSKDFNIRDEPEGERGNWNHHHEHSNESKRSNYVQHMFRGNNFNGGLLQDTMENLKLYAIFSLQNRLSQAQKSEFLVHVFDGSARKFLFDKINDNMSHNEMVCEQFRTD